MATLTGQQIKNTYDAVLKLDDNSALTSTLKTITDGLGNNTPISVSTIKVDVSSDLEASSFVKTSGLSTQFLKADGSVDSSAYLTSGDLPVSHWSSNLVGIDYAGGNVGIGTTSPGLALDINSGVANSALRVLSTDRYTGIKFQDVTNNDTLFYDGQNDLMYLGSTNFRAVDIYATGDVGIGTTSPKEKLDISAGSIRLDDNQRISWSSNNFNIGRVRITGNEPNDFITIATDNSERVRINNTGVGIGTTNPGQKLEVNGQVLSSGYRLDAMQTAPAARNSTGTLGEIVIDGNYIYVCYAANSWSRVLLITSW
jgi:hypothetical protein